MVRGTDTAEAPRSTSPRYAIARGSSAARLALASTVPGSQSRSPGRFEASATSRTVRSPARPAGVAQGQPRAGLTARPAGAWSPWAGTLTYTVSGPLGAFSPSSSPPQPAATMAAAASAAAQRARPATSDRVSCPAWPGSP